MRSSMPPTPRYWEAVALTARFIARRDRNWWPNAENWVAVIAVRVVRDFITNNPDALDEVLFVCFGDRAEKEYAALLKP